MADGYSTALPAPITNLQVDRAGLTISIATDREIAHEAQPLVRAAYEKMGYIPKNPAAATRLEPPSHTIIARIGMTVVGTLTLGLDTPAAGLKADEVFSDVLAGYRSESKGLCEITKFAIAPETSSRLIQRELFKFAMEVAIASGRDVAIIEVNPRHVTFYQKLGFEAHPETRTNRRVNAPAVLRTLDLKKGLNARMAA
jgi:ribosomal protein S18 acetylase RimI-like enzyme